MSCLKVVTVFLFVMFGVQDNSVFAKKPMSAKKAFNKMGKGIEKAAKDTGKGIEKAAKDTGKFFSNLFDPVIKIPKEVVALSNNTSQPIHIYQIPLHNITAKEQHIHTLKPLKQAYRLVCDPGYIYTLKQSNKSLDETKKGKMGRLLRQKRNDYILLSPEVEAKHPVIQNAFSCLDNGKQIIVNNAKQGIQMAQTYSVHTANYKGDGSIHQVRALTMGLVSAAVFIAACVVIVLTAGAATPGVFALADTSVVTAGGMIMTTYSVTAINVAAAILIPAAAAATGLASGIAVSQSLSAVTTTLLKDDSETLVPATGSAAEGQGISSLVATAASVYAPNTTICEKDGQISLVDLKTVY